MRFGNRFRAVRVHQLLPDANRKQIRDYIRQHQRRNDGSFKETRPEPPRQKETE